MNEARTEAMKGLIDFLLARSKEQNRDHVECQVIVNGIGPMSGPLAHGPTPGTYFMKTLLQAANSREHRLADAYFTADQVLGVLIPNELSVVSQRIIPG